MIKYIAYRLLVLIPVLLGVTVIISSLIYFVPGDPALVILGHTARPEAVQRLREELHLDSPFYLRYINWLSSAIRGDFGRSWQRREDVLEMLVDRLPASMEIAAAAMLLSLLFAVPIGVISATRPHTILDNTSMLFALFWISMPSFWFALVAILVFSVGLGIFPISGRGGPLWTLTGIRHLILPAFVLGARQIAILSRLTRTKMLEVLTEDYIRTARSKGLSERIVTYKHALRNALIPFVTVFGLQIPALIGLTVIIETVFAWPGLGRLLVDAVFKRDFPLVQGIVVFYALLVVCTNLLVDLLYGYIDPRIRYD